MRSGRRSRTRALEFYWQPNDVGHPRLGLVVPRYRSTAVARNRLRRRLREILRRRIVLRMPPLDLGSLPTWSNGCSRYQTNTLATHHSLGSHKSLSATGVAVPVSLPVLPNLFLLHTRSREPLWGAQGLLARRAADSAVPPV
jgi:ribonuclease P protein component